jgi:cell wall-associated NlpC family hydrolase
MMSAQTQRKPGKGQSRLAVGTGCLVVPLVLLIALGGMLVVVSSSDDPAANASVAGGWSAFAIKDIPPEYLEIYQATVAAFPGLPPQVLAGIGKVESNHGRGAAIGIRSGVNFLGCCAGPMQFNIRGSPSTWDAYGDGVVAHVYDPHYAIPAAARLLWANWPAGHTMEGLRKAIFQYNHSWDYVDEVMGFARDYTAPVGANVAAALVAGTLAANSVLWAAEQLGVPYSWGGGDLNGPTEGFAQGKGIVGFDCSSLTRYAVYRASGGRIVLPRVTMAQAQYVRQHGGHVNFRTVRDLVPGDLIFFNTDKPYGHERMYAGNGYTIEAPQTGEFVKWAPFSAANLVEVVRPSQMQL